MAAVLRGLLLACSITASPITFNGIQPRVPAQPPSIPSTAFLQSPSSDAAEPWGPSEFRVNKLPFAGSYILQEEACFDLAVEMVGQLADGDFEGRLPERRQIFRLARYPRMAISVAAAEGQPNLLRRHLLWAVARAMNIFIQENRFQAAGFELVWRRETVGSIFILGASSGFHDASPPANVPEIEGIANNVTADSLIADRLTFVYTKAPGAPMTLRDVCMGAIGALIETAQYNLDTSDQFVGTLAGHKTFWVFTSPTRLAKSTIIITIRAAVLRMIRSRDYRQLRIRIGVNGREVGIGMAVDFVSPDQQGMSAGSVPAVATL